MPAVALDAGEHGIEAVYDLDWAAAGEPSPAPTPRARPRAGSAPPAQTAVATPPRQQGAPRAAGQPAGQRERWADAADDAEGDAGDGKAAAGELDQAPAWALEPAAAPSPGQQGPEAPPGGAGPCGGDEAALELAREELLGAVRDRLDAGGWAAARELAPTLGVSLRGRRYREARLALLEAAAAMVARDAEAATARGKLLQAAAAAAGPAGPA